MRERARDPEDPVARFLHAVAVFYDARFAEAIPLFQQLEPRLPHEARVQIYLAMAHYWQGHVADAQRHARRAVEQGPLDPDVYYVRSKVHQDEDRAAAIRDLQRYIDLAEAPGSITFADKTARIRAELAALQRGERPPDWDRPGFDGDRQEQLTRWLSLGLAVVIGVAVLWRRRREAVA
jgi:tetratricopeptide (TPR) repeat protein